MARRKTLKKEEFNNLPNCFNRQAKFKGRWAEYFGNDHPITLELGCGKAEFIYELAQRYPERNYIGIDLKPDRLWKPAKDAIAAGIKNLAFLHIHLLEIRDHFADNEAAEIWITFPDPFPKNRQEKHRMTNPAFLAQYEQVLRPQGLFYLKTDNLPFFQYSLEVLVRRKELKLKELSFHLHEDERIKEEAKIKTTYEKQFLEMGMSINYVCWEVVKDHIHE